MAEYGAYETAAIQAKVLLDDGYESVCGYRAKLLTHAALVHCGPSQLLLMDKLYFERIKLRRAIMHDHSAIVLGANPVIDAAARELYTYLIGHHLPTRFPTMFQRLKISGSRYLRNKVTNELVPVVPPKSGHTCLRILGAHIDEDFLLLLPDPESKTAGAEPKYKLEGFVNCFPSGFKASEKMNLRLAAIHAPVPGYAAKLEKSMDRYFAAMPVGKVVQRANWGIQTHGDLYAADHANHAYDGDEVKEEAIDIAQTYLRCERQTLHRLPQTGAMVFAFRTYLTPVSQVKEEGLGEDLAKAIDGLTEGNVPEMNVYKKGVVWGPAVKEYLRDYVMV